MEHRYIIMFVALALLLYIIYYFAYESVAATSRKKQIDELISDINGAF